MNFKKQLENVINFKSRELIFLYLIIPTLKESEEVPNAGNDFLNTVF